MRIKNDMIVSEYLIKVIADYGVKHIFGYIGARNILIVEAVYKNENTKFINVYHEQTASFSACAYARISGIIGVAVATSGPGGTNMLTGIANAFCDSIPVLFITGQAAVGALRESAKIRNRSPQEVDIVSMAQSVTKYAVQIKNKNDIRFEIEKALFIANAGGKGPVLIDIPEDIQRSEINPDDLIGFEGCNESLTIPKSSLDNLKILVKKSSRPIFIIGEGAYEFERELSDIGASGVPIVASMSAIDIYDNSNPNYLGVAGNYGLRCANFALSNADLIICLGCSMIKRYTGNDINKFAPEAKLVRIDIDAEELFDRTLKEDELKIHIGLKEFFLNHKDIFFALTPSRKWVEQIKLYKDNYFFENKSDAFTPYSVMYNMNEVRMPNDIICADVGSHQIWAIQALSFSKGQKFVSTSGLSSMGYGLPAAIGAYYANSNINSDSDIICIAGDGGFQMNIQELQLLKRKNLPITIIIMNNASLGMIKTLLGTYYNGKYYASKIDYSVPGFVKVAESYGIDAVSVDNLNDFAEAFSQRGKKPLLIDVKISCEFDITPRITERRAIWDMFPFLSGEELSENMLVEYLQ